MSRRPRWAVAVVAGATLVGCGSDADPVELVVEPAVTQIQEGLDAVDDSSALACQGERTTLELAVEAYTALQGEPPADESALVGDWIRELSERFDVVDGTVVPAPGSPCS